MKTRHAMLPAVLVLALAAAWANADIELSDADGQRYLLKDDGSWRPISPGKKPAVLAELQLLQRVEAPGGCRFEMNLNNKLPYEISSLVPGFSAYRSNGVVYASKLTSFGSVKPGDQRNRELQFEGISCQDIARLQVQGGDRCEMGELNKFSDVKGRCLALLRVLPSELLKFSK
jgi:hypothetical protein